MTELEELRAMLSLMATRILDLETRVFDLETELHYTDRQLT